MTPSSHAEDEAFDFLPWIPERLAHARGWTASKQKLFVADLMRHGSVSRAADFVGKTARSAYLLRDKPGAEQFAVAWDAAVERGTRTLIALALPRARDGHQVPVTRRGQQVGTRTVYNDRLAIAVLDARNRERRAVANHYAPTTIDQTRDRLERWETSLRRREDELAARAEGKLPDTLTGAEQHALLLRAIAADERDERLRLAREKLRKEREAARRPRVLPRVRAL